MKYVKIGYYNIPNTSVRSMIVQYLLIFLKDKGLRNWRVKLASFSLIFHPDMISIDMQNSVVNVCPYMTNFFDFQRCLKRLEKSLTQFCKMLKLENSQEHKSIRSIKKNNTQLIKNSEKSMKRNFVDITRQILEDSESTLINSKTLTFCGLFDLDDDDEEDILDFRLHEISKWMDERKYMYSGNTLLKY